MAEIHHLKNAPITEALIDLRIKPSLNSSFLSALSSVTEIQNRYPERQVQRRFKGGFGLQEGQPFISPPEESVIGYIYKSPDKHHMVQYRLDGFTFNRLKPYTGWENIIAEARKLWNIYHNKTSPELISRIAVRYINRIDLPLPITDFSDYLTAPPSIPKNAPQAVSSFLTRVVVHDSEWQLDANITQAMERSAKRDFVTVIIDVDAYKAGEFVPQTDDIWMVFNHLRDLKNRIFFGSITEKTARMFE